MRSWLKELRVHKNFTRKKLANVVNVDVTSIAKYEQGERRPSPEVAQRIADVLGFDWTKFFDGEADTA